MWLGLGAGFYFKTLRILETWKFAPLWKDFASIADRFAVGDISLSFARKIRSTSSVRECTPMLLCSQKWPERLPCRTRMIWSAAVCRIIFLEFCQLKMRNYLLDLMRLAMFHRVSFSWDPFKIFSIADLHFSVNAAVPAYGSWCTFWKFSKHSVFSVFLCFSKVFENF